MRDSGNRYIGRFETWKKRNLRKLIREWKVVVLERQNTEKVSGCFVG